MEAICTTNGTVADPSWWSEVWNLHFMAHGHCYLWRPEILWPQVIADSLIALSYYSIPVILLWFVRRRRDIPFHRIFLVFALFILACGTTHIIEVISVWEPMYRLQAVMKVITATISILAVIMLIPTFPQALALPSLAQSHRRLNQVAEELQRSNQDLAQFAYLAAHDLQEPMRMVTMHLDLLERRLPKVDSANPEISKHLAFAREGADRMRSRLDGLLAYGVLDEMPTATEPVAVEPVVREVLNDLKSSILAAQADVIVSDPGSIPIPVEQLRLVVRHLLSNSLTFHHESGPAPRIVVSGGIRAEGRYFSITDNGIGIEPAHLERVQRMFHRLHSQERFPGLGVGLAIVKKIAVRNGGRLEISSRIGVGTTVTLSFPS